MVQKVHCKHLIECFISTAGASDVIDPKSDELSKLAKSKGLKCFKAADYTNSNDFVNSGHRFGLRNI